MIDLAELDTIAACDKGAWVELLHPATREPLGVFFNVYGVDSTVARKHIQDTTDRAIKRAASGKDFMRTSALREEEEIDLLTLCTTGWRTGDKNVLVFAGKEIPFSIPEARKIYASQPWIKRQIDAAIGDLKRFFSVSAPAE